MGRLIINGGKQLRGIWEPSGNKNEALPLIASTLLFRDGITLKNLPKIEDVKTMLKIADVLKKSGEFPLDLTTKVRGSLLFIGPLLAINGKATIPRTGGDKIGLRKIDTHLEVFRAFGGKIRNNIIILDRKKYNSKLPINIWLSEPSVTATENALLIAALRESETTIKNCASEPHVVNLGRALIKGGVKIAGLGTNIISIKGVKKLKPITHKIGEDFMELGSALVISAIFGGKIKVQVSSPIDYQKIFEMFKRFNKSVTVKNGYARIVDKGTKINPAIEEISDGPWPSFPSDLMSVMIILATQCPGHYLFHEKMFESRLYFTDRLKDLGAQLVLCDPHRVLIAGPSKLHGGKMSSPDIRSGMALVIAALAAKGESIIENVEQLDRGYENLFEKLKKIGTDVKRE